MNYKNITIRSAGADDMLRIYEQICALEAIELEMDHFKSIYIHNINNENILYYLAETEQGECIGFISCHIQLLLHHCGKVAEIQEMFVENEYRNKGIGALLVQTVEKEIISRNCVSYEVTAQNKRLKAHQFYEKMGFLASHLKYTKTL